MLVNTSKINSIVLVSLFITAFSCKLQAQDFPMLKPESNCTTKWTENGALNNSMMRYCLDQEQNAYNQLRPLWNSLSTSVRSICLRKWGIISDTDSSYRMLQYCVGQETVAAEKNAQTRFRY